MAAILKREKNWNGFVAPGCKILIFIRLVMFV